MFFKQLLEKVFLYNRSKTLPKNAPTSFWYKKQNKENIVFHHFTVRTVYPPTLQELARIKTNLITFNNQERVLSPIVKHKRPVFGNGETTLVLKENWYPILSCTGVTVLRAEGELWNQFLSWHIFISLSVYNTPLNLLHPPRIPHTSLCVFPLCSYIRGRIIVCLKNAVSSVHLEPEMMCKIAFFKSMQAGKRGVMKQTHHKQDWQIV